MPKQNIHSSTNKGNSSHISHYMFPQEGSSPLGSKYAHSSQPIFGLQCPAIRPAAAFMPETDATSLHKAMKGLGTNETVVINITANRSNQQRLQICETFARLFGQDLFKALGSELSFDFKHLVLSCYKSFAENDADTVHWAIKSLKTNEDMLNLVIMTRTGDELNELKKIYSKKYNRSIESDICPDSSQYSRVLLEILKGYRSCTSTVDTELSRTDANELYSAGVGRCGTNGQVFQNILTLRSYSQLRQTFKDYAIIHGHTILQAIEEEMAGNLKNAYRTLIDYTMDPIAFFASKLYKSMKGLGTIDRLLCYVIVSRSEIDLANISDAYLRIYKVPLTQHITDDTSGDYKKLLLQLASGN